MVKTLYEGLKFGMLLQIAIGPVCIYIFSLGTNLKFIEAFKGVLGVVLGDALYMSLAILGISSFVRGEKIQKKFNFFGAAIIILFGIELVLGYFGISIFPKVKLLNGMDSSLPFLKAFFLTVANPMTILFWVGIFSTKRESQEKKSTILFGVGALGSTLLFLSIISFIGTITNSFVPDKFILLLNMFVGLVLIYFGIKKIR